MWCYHPWALKLQHFPWFFIPYLFAWYTSTQTHISRSHLSVHMSQMQNHWMGFDIHKNWNCFTSHTSNENLSPSCVSGRRNVRILLLRRYICCHSSDPNATSEIKIGLLASHKFVCQNWKSDAPDSCFPRIQTAPQLSVTRTDYWRMDYKTDGPTI